MLKTYHLCFTSHKEVMYRNDEDMKRAFNCLCSALYRTESRCLAENDLPNHHHGCYETACPGELVQLRRQSYTRYFNEKYGRKGPLGDKGYFAVELQGLRHKLTAISYTLRNTVHHGFTATPFEWPYSSANAYFRKELGKRYVPDLLLTPVQIEAALPRRAQFNPKWQMGIEGVFLRESIMETAVVENLYATSKAFNYYLTRLSGRIGAGNRKPTATVFRQSPSRTSKRSCFKGNLPAPRPLPTCFATKRPGPPRCGSMICSFAR